MTLAPEHDLPGLVHAHHMAPRGTPGHSVDSSAEERKGQFREASEAGPAAWVLPLIMGTRNFEALSEPAASPIKWVHRAVRTGKNLAN